MIEIKSLKMKFKKNTVLKGIDFTFTGGVYGLLGPNGAGKTTLIRSMAGLYQPKEGQILYNGKPIGKSKEYISRLGYLPQGFGIFKELKPIEALMLMANLKGIDKKIAEQDARRVLEIVNLSDSVDKKVGAFSGGMLRRLGIAQALLVDPEIVIFDEPTAGLDPEERLRFKNIISRLSKEKIVIISTHIVEDIEAVCDKIIVMNEGNIIKSGSCSEIEQCAKDKIYLVPVNDAVKLSEKAVIQKYFEREGQQLMRVLSNESLDYEKGDATIEDGYICLLKGI
ncbi:MAG: ABC transporter ATP-binding protein [Eubacterium sp.]|nr:ABC transporter ATP-binding protein [Eubacterium sp.]